jgi:hypothetical protein
MLIKRGEEGCERGVVRTGRGDGWHDSDIVQLLYVQFLTHKGRQDL